MVANVKVPNISAEYCARSFALLRMTNEKKQKKNKRVTNQLILTEISESATMRLLIKQ